MEELTNATNEIYNNYVLKESKEAVSNNLQASSINKGRTIKFYKSCIILFSILIVSFVTLYAIYHVLFILDAGNDYLQFLQEEEENEPIAQSKYETLY